MAKETKTISNGRNFVSVKIFTWIISGIVVIGTGVFSFQWGHFDSQIARVYTEISKVWIETKDKSGKDEVRMALADIKNLIDIVRDENSETRKDQRNLVNRMDAIMRALGVSRNNSNNRFEYGK